MSVAITGDREKLQGAAAYEYARRKLLGFVKVTWPRYEVAEVHRRIAEELQAFEEAVERKESPRLMIFMPPRVGKPIYDKAMILMDDGTYKALEDVKRGDAVVTHKGISRRVEAVHVQGELPCVRITTASGRQTTAALDHPFLTPSGWVNAGDLRVGMTLANLSAALPGRRDGDELIPTQAFALAGYLIGDGATGFVGRGTGINAKITAFDTVERAHIKHCVEMCGFTVGKDDVNAITLTGGARKWLREIGLAGHGSKTKRVPPFVFGGSREQIGAFVGAYFACDGHVNKRGQSRRDARVEFYSVNQELLRDVQRLLLRLGIQSILAGKRSTYNAYTKGPHLSYRLAVGSQDDIARFVERVDIHHGKKFVLREWAPQRKAFDSQYLPDEIVAVVDAGTLPCRCLTVAVDHTFTADDFVVHNSELASRRFPPWVLGRHPDWNIFLVSYGAELAEELSADARRVVMDDAYRAIFGATYELDPSSSVELDRASKSVAFWRIAGHRGGLRAVGVGGSLTGRGADVLIVDDPIKGRKEADSKGYKDDLWRFYTGTLYDRVEPGGGILIMQTRWAVDDLAGRLLALSGDDEDGNLIDKWKVLSIPAQAEEGVADPLGRKPGEWMGGRFTPEKWERIRANTVLTSERDWYSKYQQRPLPEEGAVFRVPDDFRFEAPPNGWRGPRYLFADTSYGKTQESDFSDLQVWQMEPNGSFGLLDNVHERVAFPELKRMARRLYLKHGCWGAIIEDYGSGSSLIQEFARESGMRVVPWRPDRDKRSRAFAATDIMRGGIKRVRLPNTPLFPSGRRVKDLLDSLATFTGLGDQHDDDVDVLTMALICMGTHQTDRKWKQQTQFEFEIVA